MFEAGSSGESPEQALKDKPSRIRVYFDPHRTENLITRRLTRTTSPINARKGLELNPETP